MIEDDLHEIKFKLDLVLKKLNVCEDNKRRDCERCYWKTTHELSDNVVKKRKVWLKSPSCGDLASPETDNKFQEDCKCTNCGSAIRSAPQEPKFAIPVVDRGPWKKTPAEFQDE